MSADHKIKLADNILFVEDATSPEGQPRNIIYYKGSELVFDGAYYDLLMPYGTIETLEKEVKVEKKKKSKEE